MPTLICAALSAHDPKPVHSSSGDQIRWRCHAYDQYKRVFFATIAQGSVLLPLLKNGGGQEIYLRYDKSSTLATLDGAVNPQIDALLKAQDSAPSLPASEVATALRSKNETLAERARLIFDATPSRHPGGHIPNWDIQPDHIKRIFAGFAARLPYDGFGRGQDRDELPQETLRTIANSLWKTNRSAPALTACSALWAAAAALDLDLEGANHMMEDLEHHAPNVPQGLGTKIIADTQITELQEIRDRLADNIKGHADLEAIAPIQGAVTLLSYVIGDD